jgi:CBS domain-containing membrane protein
MVIRHHHANPSTPAVELVVRGWLGAVAGMGSVAWLSLQWLPESGYFLTIGSFGASSVLLFGIHASPFAQPRNLFGGHLISTLIGVSCYMLLTDYLVLAIPLAVATAIAAMQVSRTLHPPGGATALIAVIGGEQIHALGYGLLIPVLTGLMILFVAAWLSLNLFSATRRYPTP